MKNDQTTIKGLLDAYSMASQRDTHFRAFEREADRDIGGLEQDSIDCNKFFSDVAERVEGVRVNSVDVLSSGFDGESFEIHEGYDSPSGQIQYESTRRDGTRNYWVRNTKGNKHYKVNIRLDCKIEPAIVIC